MESKVLYFFSNHSDLRFLRRYFPDKYIVRIPHPYLNETWGSMEVVANCQESIQKALSAPELIINGDYFLVSYIVQKRSALGKRTGFISFEKLTKPVSGRVGEKVYNKTIMRPVGVRWL